MLHTVLSFIDLVLEKYDCDESGANFGEYRRYLMQSGVSEMIENV